MNDLVDYLTRFNWLIDYFLLGWLFYHLLSSPPIIFLEIEMKAEVNEDEIKDEQQENNEANDDIQVLTEEESNVSKEQSTNSQR